MFMEVIIWVLNALEDMFAFITDWKFVICFVCWQCLGALMAGLTYTVMDVTKN